MLKRINFCRGNSISTTCSDYVFAALVTKHGMRMRHYYYIVIRELSASSTFFHIIS